jgi:hypothetical protein
MSEEKFTTLPAGFGYTEVVYDPTVAPGEEADYAIQPNAEMCVDQVGVYGPAGCELTQVTLPEAELSTSSRVLDVKSKLDPHQRRVPYGALILARARNTGAAPARLWVVASGTFKLGSDHETLCTLMRTVSPSKPKKFSVKRGDCASPMVLLPHAAKLLRVRVMADAPEGVLTVSAVQVANVNLVIGAAVPIEAFAGQGAALKSSPCDAGTRITIAVRCPEDAPSPEYAFTAELDVTARGVVTLKPPQDFFARSGEN